MKFKKQLETTGKVSVMTCIEKLFESILNKRLPLKMMYAKIMILTKLDSKVTPGQPIIYLYCVPLLINKGAFQSRCIYVLLILQSHLTTLIDQHFTINYCSNRGIDGNFLNVMKSMFSKLSAV